MFVFLSCTYLNMNIFQCLPKELVNYIEFLAIEPTPTAKLIKELYFANSNVLAFNDTFFFKICHCQKFVRLEGGIFETYKTKHCLKKRDSFHKTNP